MRSIGHVTSSDLHEVGRAHLSMNSQARGWWASASLARACRSISWVISGRDASEKIFGTSQGHFVLAVASDLFEAPHNGQSPQEKSLVPFRFVEIHLPLVRFHPGQEHGVRHKSFVQPPTQLTAHHRGTRATLHLVSTALCAPSPMLVHHRSEAVCPRYVPPERLVAGDHLNVIWIILRRDKHLWTEIGLHEGSNLAQLLEDHAQCLEPPVNAINTSVHFPCKAMYEEHVAVNTQRKNAQTSMSFPTVDGQHSPVSKSHLITPAQKSCKP